MMKKVWILLLRRIQWGDKIFSPIVVEDDMVLQPFKPAWRRKYQYEGSYRTGVIGAGGKVEITEEITTLRK